MEGKAKPKLVQAPRPAPPAEPEPVDDRPLSERAEGAYLERRAELDDELERRRETEAAWAGSRLAAAFGAPAETFVLEDSGLAPAQGEERWVTLWRLEGEHLLMMVRVGRTKDSPGTVTLMDECDKHGEGRQMYAVSPVGVGLAELGHALAKKPETRCPLCVFEEEHGQDDDEDESEFEMIGRVFVETIARVVQAKLEADKQEFQEAIGGR